MQRALEHCEELTNARKAQKKFYALQKAAVPRVKLVMDDSLLFEELNSYEKFFHENYELFTPKTEKEKDSKFDLIEQQTLKKQFQQIAPPKVKDEAQESLPVRKKPRTATALQVDDRVNSMVMDLTNSLKKVGVTSPLFNRRVFQVISIKTSVNALQPQVADMTRTLHEIEGHVTALREHMQTLTQRVEELIEFKGYVLGRLGMKTE